MDGSPLATAPFRDARYAPRALEVERLQGEEGETLILRNPMPYSDAVRTTTAPLARWAIEAADRIWLAERDGEGWRTVTYAQARSRVEALAGGLTALGLRRGQPLLILARNGIDHALIAYAAMSLGAPAAPVSPQYGLKGADLTRLQHAVERLKPAAVYADDAEAFGDALAARFLAGLPVVVSRNVRPEDVAFESLLESPPLAPVAEPGDVAKLLLTSGSTGKPKAVICTHANIALNAAQIEACYADPEPPVLVNSAPWSHSLGANAILHMVLHRGGTLYIDAGQPVPGRFAETVRNLSEVATTYHNMVPAGWGMFVGELERDAALAAKFFERVRVLQYGGASMAQSILDRVQAVAVRTVGERITFAAGYGATETGPTACNIHWLNARSGMVGLPTPGTAVKLVPAGDGGKFEIRVKGPQVSPGSRSARGHGPGLRRGGLLPLGRRGAAGRSARPGGGAGVRRAPGRELQAGQRHLRRGRGPAGRGGVGDRRRGVRRGGLRRGTGGRRPDAVRRRQDGRAARRRCSGAFGHRRGPIADERVGQGRRGADRPRPDPGRRAGRGQRRADGQGLYQPGPGAGSAAEGTGAAVCR